jgi:chemotaxis protein methyltransferase CheR
MSTIHSPNPHDPYFKELKKYLIESTGLVYYMDRDPQLLGHIEKRLLALNIPNCEEYLKLLLYRGEGLAERDHLINDLTIGETYFFRHKEQFEAIQQQILPAIIQHRMLEKRIRIWCAGCSIGAEPYTLAIMLKQHFFYDLLGWDVSILGTDINRNFLQLAKQGRFDEWAFRSTDAALRQEFFVKDGKSWQILPELQKRVVFQHHNLLQNPCPSLVTSFTAFDLIICRNVMIYFNEAINQKILTYFHDALRPMGWLLLGHAEQTTLNPQSFQSVPVSGVFFYQKADESREDAAKELLGSITLPNFKEGIEDGEWGEENKFLAGSDSSEKGPTPIPSEEQTIAAIRKLADRGEFAQAILAAKKYLEQNPLSSSTFFYFALALDQLGNHQEAVAALKKAVEINAQFVLAHYYLALLLLQRQKALLEARFYFDTALELLGKMAIEEIIPEGDGMTASELKLLIEINLGVLTKDQLP